MTGQRASEPIVVAIEVDEPELAERLAVILGGLSGLRLAAPGDIPDVSVVSPERAPLAEADAGLTGRELEVLTLLAEGASNKTIALRLGISVHTAKFQVGSLLDKLDATGRTDAVAHAARLGVIHL